MYHEPREKGKCPDCGGDDFYCKCPDMCLHCEHFIDNSCKNKKSGNYKLSLTYDAFCSKFSKKSIKNAYLYSKGYF